MSQTEGVRLDKWLWAARIFKTRALAVEAVEGGKVHLNRARAKKSRVVRVGDQLRIRKGPYEYQFEVLALAQRRLGPKHAPALYREDPETERVRTELVEAHRALSRATDLPRGRPTKRDRRLITKWKRED